MVLAERGNGNSLPVPAAAGVGVPKSVAPLSQNKLVQVVLVSPQVYSETEYLNLNAIKINLFSFFPGCTLLLAIV